MGLLSWSDTLAARWAGPEQSDRSDTTSEEQEPATTEEAGAHEFFAAIASAWNDENHTALAEMVGKDGVSIAIAPDPDRDSHYSPNQAFYFFKNLFRSSRCDSFGFRRLQEEGEAEPVHAVAYWSYRRAGSETPVGERLIFTLTRGASGWGLSEIRAIR
jgi:hypothetical protein